MDFMDIWLISLGTEDPEQVVREFAIEFGISLERAQEMTSRLPRVIQRTAAPEEAELVVARLRAAGLVAELRPSAPVIELSPGGRPTRSSQPVPAAPPMSLFPRAISERAPADNPSSRPNAAIDATHSTGARAQQALGWVALVVGVTLFAMTNVPGIYAVILTAIGVVLVAKRAS